MCYKKRSVVDRFARPGSLRVGIQVSSANIVIKRWDPLHSVSEPFAQEYLAVVTLPVGVAILKPVFDQTVGQYPHPRRCVLACGLSRLARSQDTDTFVVCKLAQALATHRLGFESVRFDTGGRELSPSLLRPLGAALRELVARYRRGQRPLVDPAAAADKVGGQEVELAALVCVPMPGKAHDEGIVRVGLQGDLGKRSADRGFARAAGMALVADEPSLRSPRKSRLSCYVRD